MRITGGIACNRRLASPRSYDVRPMLARVRRSLFDILADNIPHANILDLYSGVGSIGLEALSRGAEHCTFVEKSRKTLKYLNKNIEALDFGEMSTVLPLDVSKAITNLTTMDMNFNLVFIDPPFKEKGAWQSFRRLENLITESTIIVLHVATRDRPEIPEYWQLFREHIVGDSLLYFMSSQ